MSKWCVTYNKLPHILRQPGRKHVKQIVHAQLPKLGEVYQVIALGKEARRYEPKQAAQEENRRGFALARRCSVVVDDFDLGAVVIVFLGFLGFLVERRQRGRRRGRFGGRVGRDSAAECARHLGFKSRCRVVQSFGWRAGGWAVSIPCGSISRDHSRQLPSCAVGLIYNAL
jgi:hypothetical protein